MRQYPHLTEPASSTGPASQADVLIVDESSDSLEVLRTALRRKGVAAIGTCHADDGLQLARTWNPRVIVVDEDSIEHADKPNCHDYEDAARDKDAYLVLLGSFRQQAKSPSIEKMAKPYHYAALVRKIEHLLLGTNRAA